MASALSGKGASLTRSRDGAIAHFERRRDESWAFLATPLRGRKAVAEVTLGRPVSRAHLDLLHTAFPGGGSYVQNQLRVGSEEQVCYAIA